MLPPLETVTLTFVVAFTVLGILVNIFIVGVNGIDWVKTRHLDTSDIILTSLGIARFFLQWIIMLDMIISVVFPHIYHLIKFLKMFYTIWAFVDLVNAWFAALLGVFYCAKIANHSHPVFIFLKLKIPRTIHWLLLGSMLASLITSISISWVFEIPHSNSTTNISSNDSTATNCSFAWNVCKGYQKNSTEDFSLHVSSTGAFTMYPIIVLCLGYAIPFFIFCVALLLLIRSLWDHTWHIKGNTMEYCNPSLQIYFTAIRVMVSFLLLCICGFICNILGTSYLFSSKGLLFHILSIVSAAYPSLHSVILILNNSKLRQVLERIFHHSKVPSRGNIT
ncbi:taste receptor type 2 member 8-like [Microcaecilia unicolor]|uniref:Taste receptor type 2 n=1 Tax=Microcaecilia unicolor TaxID=1415580 RepID=A0A6P7WXH4_9AMPH|nr:taste receptor type 2 member 8-like [Microcaecilia unicolor]